MPPTTGRNLDFFTHSIQEISKIVCKKTLSETRAFITSSYCMKRVHYSKRMLRKQDCVLHETFFWKQLCWFPISNISYCVVHCNLPKIWGVISTACTPRIVVSTRWWLWEKGQRPLYSGFAFHKAMAEELKEWLFFVAACFSQHHLCPRKFKGGICCGGHLAITYGGELLYLQIFS